MDCQKCHVWGKAVCARNGLYRIHTEIFNHTKHINDEKGLIATEIIHTTWSNTIHIYTDGSLNPDTNTVGCGIFIPQLNYSKSIKINNSSIFAAELFAILLAVEWIEQVQPMHTSIFTDC